MEKVEDPIINDMANQLAAMLYKMSRKKTESDRKKPTGRRS